MSDIHFEQLAERFERKIYGSEKGELRLALMWDDIRQTLPEWFAGHSLEVLDAGGGLGQMTAKMAQCGHRVLLAEPAQAMISRAEELLNEQGIAKELVEYLCEPIQQLPDMLAGRQFDAVICHAVLEWLAEPLPTLATLLPLLKTGGVMSLAFYNVDSIIFKNLLKGNVNKIRANKLAGDPGSLTPQSPLVPVEVLAWLEAQGLEVLSCTGIRCLNDYLYPKVELDAETRYALEREYSRREPYKWFGRYIHVIVRKA